MICIDARYVRERPSGIGAMVDELVKRIPAILPHREFVFLRHPAARSPLSTHSNTRDVTLTAEANGPATLLFLPRLVDLSRVSLFHAPFNILPRGLRMPSIVGLHDLLWIDHAPLCRAPGLFGLGETIFYRAGIRYAVAKAARIVVPSEATRADLVRAFPRAASRARVVPHGLDPRFTPATTDEDRAAALRARDKYAGGARAFVLTVGQAAGYKNHEAAVRAFARAFRDAPDVHLVLVQRLNARARALVALADARGAAGRVHVLSTLSFDDLLALYRGALCLLHPSWIEGWGMPITEALGAGCPVVTSDRSSMPEVTGGAALFAPPDDEAAIADRLRSLATDERLRASLSARGIERARSLDWQRAAEATAAIYEEVLSSS